MSRMIDDEETLKDNGLIEIDGVNVAECEFYDGCNYTTCQIGIQDYIDCDKNPNCYFKQLQRAKAEKQEKVLKMAEAEVEIEKLQSENEKLKADNEALKEALLKVKDTIDNGCYPEFDWLVLK